MNSWRLLLLLAFVAFSSGSVYSETVIYTISAKNTLTVTGTAPTASTATIVETYSTSNQMTKDISQTLTLNGYNGCTITNITLNMRSNSSSGKGGLTYSIDGGTIHTDIVASGTAFSNDAWHGAWSTSYVDVSKNVAIVCGNAPVILQISATENSLYCQSYTITYSLPSLFNITPTSNNSAWGTVSLVGNTITASPEEGYRVSTTNPYTVTGGVTVTDNGDGTFRVDATTDCTVQINFEAIPTYTITFNAGSGSCTTTTLTELIGEAGVELPSAVPSDACLADGWSFVGWSTINVTESAVVPIVSQPGSTYYLSEDIALYAVYKKSVISSNSETYTCSITSKQWNENASNAVVLNGISWQAQGVGGGYAGFTSAKGHQFGSSNNSFSSISLTATIPGLISEVKVSTSGANNIVAYVSISVGSSVFTPSQQSITSTNTAYSFTGSS